MLNRVGISCNRLATLIICAMRHRSECENQAGTDFAKSGFVLTHRVIRNYFEFFTENKNINEFFSFCNQTSVPNVVFGDQN